ncbi:hypothetical protein ACI8AC_17205 [Geodermatophilus sp. SYSU D00758]
MPTPTGVRASISQVQVDSYAEEVCRHIDECSAVQLAQVECYLDGATLAGEQVQDVRISLLEQPAELSGWDFWLGLGITFLLESNFVGAALRSITTRVFTPLVRSNAVWLRIPKSPSGHELVALAERARSLSLPTLIEPGRGRLTFDSVLEGGAAGMGGRASRESLQLYHSAIQELIRVVEPLDVAQGLAQTANQARQSGRPRSNDPLSFSDSPGFVVLAAAQEYAQMTRLGIAVRSARFRSFARARASIKDLAALVEATQVERLDHDGQAVSLGALRRRCALDFEALIWSRLHGFHQATPGFRGRAGPGHPALGADNDEPLKGVRVELVDYWLNRFSPSIRDWATRQGWAPMPDQGRLARSTYLRAYFAALSADVEKAVRPASTELASLPPSAT